MSLVTPCETRILLDGVGSWWTPGRGADSNFEESLHPVFFISQLRTAYESSRPVAGIDHRQLSGCVLGVLRR
jgi:hypothetical protein